MNIVTTLILLTRLLVGVLTPVSANHPVRNNEFGGTHQSPFKPVIVGG